MKSIPKIFLKSIVLLLVLCILTGCSRQPVSYTATDIAMGTVLNQTVYTTGEDETGNITELVRSLERDTLSWRVSDSEIAGLNASQAGIPMSLSEELWEDLLLLQEVSKQSGGAFDFTLGTLTGLWNIDAQAQSDHEEIRIPTEEEIARALENSGYDKVLLKDGCITLEGGIQLDLGAAGKGIACDRIGDYLKGTNITGAVISVGGSVITYGGKPDGSPWQVGIVNPEDTSRLLGTFSLTGEWYISTSGDYERYIEVDGIRYHHILDPTSGYPAQSNLRSVTVIAKSGALSDALSTACFVLGQEEGMALAAYFNAETVFVDKEGNLYLSEGIKDIFRQTAE
ncbi:MAG: FAD:protein FMN transferase [Lachnospiraceae bacterium]|nr:FAD:protein FMN transferase [Lachnospiraceae bacterium]